MSNSFYKNIVILISLSLGLLMPIQAIGIESKKSSKSPEYIKYEKTLKQIKIQNKVLDDSEKAWKKTFQNRYNEYVSILGKLDKIDSSLYKKWNCESLNQDYKYVVELWRSFVEDSFANISGSVIDRNLPELITFEEFSPGEDLSGAQILELEKKYQKFKTNYNNYSKKFDIALEKDTLHYNKILLSSGKLRSKIYQRLSGAKDKSVYEFTNENIEDIWREIRIIPLRWTATFYSKILEFRDHLNAGPVGYMVVLKELTIFGILLLFLIGFFWFYNRLTDNFEEIAESYLRKAYRSNEHWFLQYILSLLNKSMPLLVLQLGLWFVESILAKTTISELAEFVPYISYYIMYRLSLIITSYTITRLKSHNFIVIDYTLHAKILRCFTAILKFTLFSWMILHTIEAIVGEAIIYNICYKLSVFIGLVYSIYLIDKWRLEIFKYLSHNFSLQTYLLLKPQFHNFYAPLVSYVVFLMITLDKLLDFMRIWLDRFDFARKISAKIFLSQIKKSSKSNKEEILKELPDSYTKVFARKENILDFLIEPQEFVDYRLTIEKWLENKTRAHSIMIYGGYGSGKTTLISSLGISFNKDKVKNISFSTKSLTSKLLLDKLRDILGGKSNDIDVLIEEWNQREEKIVICIDDAHNLFLSNPGGCEVIKSLIHIINGDIKNIFWVVAFHNYSWDYLSKALECHQCFDKNIRLESWSSEDLENLIMNRHKETNFELSYDDIFFALEKKHLKETIDYMKSKFFKLLWEQFDGNPARAIRIWLSSLRYSGYSKTLHVSLPPELDLTSILDIGSNLLFVCSAILRHEFLSSEEIQLVTNQSEDTILYILKLCQKKDIVIQDAELNYKLNPEYAGDIIRVLKRKIMSTDNMPIDYLSTLSDIFRFEKILLILLGISFLIFLSKGIKALSESLYNKAPTKKTLIFQISTILAFVLNIFGSFYIFYAILNPPREFLIAILGSITFASGLAIKDLVASVISGITIIIDPPFQVGDRIRFKDIYGEIKHIGLRAIKVHNLDNQIITIPNQNFLNDMVLCANSGQININVIVNFYIALEANLDKAKSILREVVTTSRFAYLNEPILVIADHTWRADVLCVELTLKAHAINASFEKEFQTDIITRANEAFIRENIPFPKSVGLSNNNQ